MWELPHAHDELVTWIRETRVRAGLSQEDVARRAGMSRAHLARIERGKVALQFSMLASICYVFGYHLTYTIHERTRWSAK
jgi:transcriptional regulator with XRE-family HTH domain